MKNPFTRSSGFTFFVLGDYYSEIHYINHIFLLITSHQDNISTIIDFSHVLHVYHKSILN